MRLAIIGAGSLGLLWASRAVSCVKEVYLFTRTEEQKERIKQEGIRVRGISSFSENDVKTNTLNHFQNEQMDMIWMMVKQPAIKNVLLALKPHITPDVPIVFWQNGMGHLELANELLPNHRSFFVAITSEGAKRIDDRTVVHTGEGITRVGEITRSPIGKESILSFIQQMSKRHLIDIAWDQEIRTRMWKKLLVNCVINPLTGILQVPNGELLCEDKLPLVKKATAEAVRIANASGEKFHFVEIFTEVVTIARKTARNYSSLYQDLLHHRPTEIHWLNGYLQRLGLQLGMNTPIQDALITLVKALEQRNHI